MRRRAFLAAGAATSTAGCLGYTITSTDEAAANQEQIGDLEAELDERDERIAELEARLAEKQSTIETIEAEHETLEVELATKRDRIDELTDERIDRIVELEELEQEIERLEPEHDFSESELDRAVSVIQDVRTAVVRVVHGWGSGAGFHLGDGVFLTPYHVARGRDERGILGEDIDRERWEFTVGASDPDIDAQLLTATTHPDETVSIGEHADLEADDPIVMVGHPHNVGQWVGSVGRYRATDRDASPFDIVHVADIPIKGGNSGSPVLTVDGAFVGMAVASRTNRELYDAPDEPFTHFEGYPPDGMIIPGRWLTARLDI